MAKSNKQFKTFKDLHGDESGEDSEDEKNFFTGGEKSGLEVEKPPEDQARMLVQELLNEAAANAHAPDTRESMSSSREFSGSGYRLGTEEQPSEIIRNVRDRRREKVKRKCHFWKDGFSIDDGPLYKYSDPRNKAYIEEMKQGNAPLHLFDALPGQSVDIEVETHEGQNYRPPKSKANTFSGAGHRLGSPVPGEIVDSGKQKIEPEEVKLSTVAKEEPLKEDEEKTVIQVRFADGRSMKVAVKKQGPVQQVFDFVDTIFRTEGQEREYFLSLSYPVKPITDKEASIQDAKLTRSVIIQRWK